MYFRLLGREGSEENGGEMTRGLVVDSPPALGPLLPHHFPPVFQMSSHHANKTLNSHPLHSKLKVGFPVSSSVSDLDSGRDEMLLEGFAQGNI